MLSERVAKLLPKICSNYTLIDTKDYPVEGISEKYRGRVLSFLLMHAVTQRIDAHVEQMKCHPLEIRRYYRQFDWLDRLMKEYKKKAATTAPFIF